MSITNRQFEDARRKVQSPAAESLHRRVPTHLGGLWLATVELLLLMDRPGMTIERLRGSQPATMFRAQVLAFRQWMIEASQIVPGMTPEEKKFLEHWFKELDRADQR